MKKLPKLGLNFWYGDNLKHIKSNVDGLFPLYVVIRIGRASTKIKSITASYWFDCEAGTHFTQEEKYFFIEEGIKSYIQKDTNYINWARDLHIKAYEKDFEDWKFLQNKRVRDSLNVPVSNYFNYLVFEDFERILIKYKMGRVAEYILPIVGAFTLLHCMNEINRDASLELKNNEKISTLFEAEMTYHQTSLIEFMYRKIPEESIRLKKVQSELLEKTVNSFRLNDPNFFFNFVK